MLQYTSNALLGEAAVNCRLEEQSGLCLGVELVVLVLLDLVQGELAVSLWHPSMHLSYMDWYPLVAKISWISFDDNVCRKKY